MDLLLSCSVGLVGGLAFIGMNRPDGASPPQRTASPPPATEPSEDDETTRKNEIIMEKLDRQEIEIGDFNWVKMLDWIIFSAILLALLFALNYKTHGSFLAFLERIFPQEFETMYKIFQPVADLIGPS